MLTVFFFPGPKKKCAKSVKSNAAKESNNFHLNKSQMGLKKCLPVSHASQFPPTESLAAAAALTPTTLSRQARKTKNTAPGASPLALLSSHSYCSYSNGAASSFLRAASLQWTGGAAAHSAASIGS